MTDKKTELRSSASPITPLVAQVVAAYVANHTVDIEQLPGLVAQLHKSFARIEKDEGSTPVGLGEPPEPKVPIRKSITAEHIYCLEDGKPLKMLKRHLKTAYNLTPEQYRERWRLPADYPMVAANYAKKRSQLAKQAGLGNSRRNKG